MAPLERAWKVRLPGLTEADLVRKVLLAQGWKCTPATAALDVPGTVVFRVSRGDARLTASLDDVLRQIPGVELHLEGPR